VSFELLFGRKTYSSLLWTAGGQLYAPVSRNLSSVVVSFRLNGHHAALILSCRSTPLGEISFVGGDVGRGVLQV
jgi:hypothetical protein